MARPTRPLSPHLQVYRLPLTAILSITHRITGVGLALGAILLVAWLAAAAAGPGWFAVASGLAGSWLGRLILLGFAWALIYHLINGIRHLFWDAGFGFEKSTARSSGLVTLIVSIVATGLVFTVGLLRAGVAP